VALEQLRPSGLWLEAARVCDHGFNRRSESFAEMMARALGINSDELRVCIAENRIGSALHSLPITPRYATTRSPAQLDYPLNPRRMKACDALHGIHARWSAPRHLLHHGFVVHPHNHPKPGELFAGQVWDNTRQRSIQRGNTQGN